MNRILTARRTAMALALACSAGAPRAADPVEPAGWQTELKLGSGLYAEGARDLGLGDAESTAEGFVDAQGTLYWNSGRNWAGLTRAQLFAPTGELVVRDEDQPRESETFVRLRELWIEYSGFTSYPGEVLRLGLQRLRDPDGQWFDRNIEAVRWIFDTTLVQGHLGAAESFLTWRSDESDPESNLRDRSYFFGGVGTQWTAGHFLGARAIHASDHGDPEQEIADGERDPKLNERKLTWLDLYLHNDYYEPRAVPGWSYWADASVLLGTRETYTPPTELEPLTREEHDVRAWAWDLGLRWKPSPAPFQIGSAYAFASGSDGGDPEHRYEQTGLHSNRSRFTGGRTQIDRFNGAFQAELSNLHAASAYISLPYTNWDTSLVYTKFARHRAGDPVITDGVSVQPEPGRKVLGDGLDLVVAYYFPNPIGRGQSSVAATQDDDSTRSNIRLRASGFKPGTAYADEADDQYLIRLDLTLWF